MQQPCLPKKANSAGLSLCTKVKMAITKLYSLIVAYVDKAIIIVASLVEIKANVIVQPEFHAHICVTVTH